MFTQLKEELELHAHAEEQVFYPALQEADVTQEMVEGALEDHRVVGKWAHITSWWSTIAEALALSPG